MNRNTAFRFQVSSFWFQVVAAALLLGLALSAQALEIKPWPAKLRVKPGETEKITVKVVGIPPDAQEAKVRCRIVSGIDTEEAVFDKSVPVEKGKATAMFEFTPTKEWAYGVEATAEAGAEKATGFETFGCAKNPYMLSPSYGCAQVYEVDTLPDGSPAPRGKPANPGTQAAITSETAQLRATYVTVAELAGITCPLTALAPLADNYFNGWHYSFSVNGVKGMVDELHANGISSVMYTAGFLQGISGTEFARKHPEWLNYSADGSPYVERICTSTIPIHQWYLKNYPESLKQVSEMQKQNPQPETVRYGAELKSLKSSTPGLQNATLSFEDIKVSEFAAEAIMKGLEFWGIDGVRYDGEYRVPTVGDPIASATQYHNWDGTQQKTGPEAEAMTIRNLSRAWGMIRAKYPDFLIGLNNGDFRNDQRGDAMNTSPVAKVISPGVWILDEFAKAVGDAAHPDHRWADFVVNMSAQADRIRRIDDYPFFGWFSPQNKATDIKLLTATTLACGARWIVKADNLDPNRPEPASASAREAQHRYSQFAFRYGEFILNNKLERLPADKAQAAIKVESQRPVFWERFVYTLKANGQNYLVMHLVNQPVEEGVTVNAQEPPAVQDIAVQLGASVLPGAGKAPKAWLLSPDLGTAPQPLEVKSANGGLALTISSLQIWNVVMVKAE